MRHYSKSYRGVGVTAKYSCTGDLTAEEWETLHRWCLKKYPWFHPELEREVERCMCWGLDRPQLRRPGWVNTARSWVLKEIGALWPNRKSALEDAWSVHPDRVRLLQEASAVSVEEQRQTARREFVDRISSTDAIEPIE